MNSIDRGFNAEYTDDPPTFDQVLQLAGDVLLEFGTPWCGHCRAAQQAIEQAVAQYPALCHIKVNDGKGKPLGRGFRVKLWPTLILLKDGEEVARMVRPVRVDELRQLLEKT